ncbi:hypothetical protein L596_011174 [Steinernema carpocapsae]|uniref:Uncharacterized protein n=1 Tax=Steinernema carpocapsae TaxID=34508 RepID=A0A4U5NSY6_STECR|nr:hypothetical protein L596_011174 [Steinernema carpocapsae]
MQSQDPATAAALRDPPFCVFSRLHAPRVSCSASSYDARRCAQSRTKLDCSQAPVSIIPAGRFMPAEAGLSFMPAEAGLSFMSAGTLLAGSASQALAAGPVEAQRPGVR